MRTLNFSILFVYLNFNKFPSSDFRVHWNARNSELGKTNSEMTTLERGIKMTVHYICNFIIIVYYATKATNIHTQLHIQELNKIVF